MPVVQRFHGFDHVMRDDGKAPKTDVGDFSTLRPPVEVEFFGERSSVARSSFTWRRSLPVARCGAANLRSSIEVECVNASGAPAQRVGARTASAEREAAREAGSGFSWGVWGVCAQGVCRVCSGVRIVVCRYVRSLSGRVRRGFAGVISRHRQPARCVCCPEMAARICEARSCRP